MKKTLIILLVAAALLLPAAMAGAENLDLNLSPDQINIGLNFKGASLEISGNAPAGSDIYLRVESPPGTVALNRKGKVGPLWMTVENVQAENMPKIYEILSSSSLAGISPKAQDRMEIGSGYSYLKEHARVTKKLEEGKEELSPGESGDFLDGLINIYEKKGYYKIGEGALQVDNGRFRANVQLPSGIPPGQTKITAYAVKGDQVVASMETPLQVNSIGLVGWVRTEATTNGPFYGLIAVIVALLVGLTVGTLFSLGRNKGATDGAH